MGLILKQEQPGLLPAYTCIPEFHRYLDGTGVDFLRYIHILQEPLFLEHLCPNGGYVHKGLRRGFPMGIHIPAGSFVARQGLFEAGIEAGFIPIEDVQRGGKGAVPAVIRPVGIQQAELGQARLPGAGGEIGLAAAQIRFGHGQPIARLQRCKVPSPGKSGQHRNILDRCLGFLEKGIGRSLPRIHGVYQVLFHPFQAGIREGS
jgi:hypothetical protein